MRSDDPRENQAPGEDGTFPRLFEIWSQVLAEHDLEGKGFLELGGTSLHALRIAARVEEEFGVALSLSFFLENPTVTTMASEVASGKWAESREDAGHTKSSEDDRFQPFPLTPVQQAYWVGREAGADLGGVSTQSYVEVDVIDLDVSRLQAAVAKLIERHDMLRTVVLPQGLQKVLEHVPVYDLPYEDLTALEPAEADARLESVRGRMARDVKAPDRWPLFEVRVHRLTEALYRLHVTVDFIVADARSIEILTLELMQYYESPEAKLPERALTFRDYVLALEQGRESSRYQRARNYWLGRVESLPPPPSLPLATRPGTIVPSFARLSTSLTPPQWVRFAEKSGRAGVTSSAALCTAFARVLQLWCGSDHFTLTMTTLGRMHLHPDVEGLVGDLASVVMTEIDLRAANFAALARRVQNQIWEDLRHQHFDGVEFIRACRGHSGTRSAPPIVFTSTIGFDQAQPQAAPRAEALRIDRIVFGVSQTPQVLLDYQVGEVDGRLRINWDFAKSHFPPGLVETMFNAHRDLIDRLADDENAWADW